MNWPWWHHQMETFSALLAFMRSIHQSPVNSPHKSQWRGSLMFSLICVRINGGIKNHEAGDLERHRAHYNVFVMWIDQLTLMAQVFSRNHEVHIWYGPNFQSLWPSGVIWRYTPLWTLVRVIIWTDVDLWSVSAHDIHLSAISTTNH